MNFLLKPKFLLWIVAILLFINIATFLGIFFTHGGHHPMDRDKDELFDKLALTEQQKQTFTQRREFYKEANCYLYTRYDSLMLQIRLQIAKNAADTTAIFSLTDSLGKVNGQIGKNWVKYSLEVRSCLNSQQQHKMDSLSLVHMMEKIGGKRDCKNRQ